MFIQDLVLCLQVTADNFTPKKPSDCFLKLPCGCPNPGKELQCEECDHLEACLSKFQPLTAFNRNNHK